MHSWIGTSGFQYKEWKGKFYPDDLPVSRMLGYYSEHFDTTEINYTFRQIPSAATISRWASLTPQKFSFSLKAPQRITHFAKLRDCGAILRVFREAILPLGDKLGPVLIQLPATFRADSSLLEDFTAAFPPDLRAAFEFRHDSWFTDTIFDILRRHQTALCIADTDDLETPFVPTAPFGYLRLRRLDYTAKKLTTWSEKIRSSHWKQAFVYFKHEDEGVGPEFATRMQKLVR